MKNDGNCLFSSNKEDWVTPQYLYDELHKEFSFTRDLAASASNAKHPNYYSEEHDSLKQPWVGVCWLNPPYGRGIGRWMHKALEASRDGATIVALVPARTDTKWWHDYCIHQEVRFIKGRLKFSGSKINAPFPSAIVIFKGKTNAP